jgi:hypothetical protein
VYPAVSPGAITTASTIVKAYTNPVVTVQNSAPASGGSGDITYQWRRSGSSYATLTGSDASYLFNDASICEKEGTYYINRYAKDVTCNTGWVAAEGVYTLSVNGPPGGIANIKCTKCCYNGSAWVDCYVSEGVSRPWGASSSDYVDGARSDKNGKANTAAILAVVGTAGLTAVQSCNSIGTGWFLPAYEELINMSMGTKFTPLNGLSGVGLLSGEYYWSSTEFYKNEGRLTSDLEDYKGLVVRVNYDGTLNVAYKTTSYLIRCAWRN